MRILLESLGFGVGDNFGGSARVSALNAAALAARGHEVEMWCTNLIDKSGKLWRESTRVRQRGLDVCYWNTSALKWWPGALGPHYVSIPRSAQESVRTFDVVHLCEFRSFLASKAAKLASRYHVPFVVQPHGTLLRYGDRRLLKFFYDALSGRQIRNEAAFFIAATQVEAQMMLEEGITPGRVTVVPNGIELHDHREIGFRKRLGIGPEIPLIISIGRIDEVKGFDLMLRAMTMVEKRAVYAVVGPDYGQADQLRSVAAELDLQFRFVLVGPLADAADVVAAIAEADVFVLPSRHEAFGQVILEACLASKPMVLSSGVNSAADFADRAALVVPPEPAALAQAVNTLLGNADLRARFGAEGRAMLDRDYRIEAVAAKLERVYESAISRN